MTNIEMSWDLDEKNNEITISLNKINTKKNLFKFQFQSETNI